MIIFLRLIILSVILLPVVAFGQEVKVAGTASAFLEGTCKKNNMVSRRADKAILADTIERAKINALRSYSAQSTIAVANSFATKEDEILADVDSYLLNFEARVVCREKTQNVRVAVSGVLNKSAWDRTLALDTVLANDRSRITAMFVARKLSTFTQFEEKQVTLSQRESLSDSSRSAVAAGDGSINAYGESSSSLVSTTGGRAERRAVERGYTIFSNDDIDAAINQGIAEQGYRVAPIAQIRGMPIEKFRNDFASGDVISPVTLNQAFDALSKLPVDVLLMVTTLDVGVAQKNANLNSTVVVSINAQVYKFDGLFYEVVASVGPSQERGEGRDAIEAERDALLNSSRSVVEQLTAQLREKQIF